MDKKVYVCKRLKLFSWLTENGFTPFKQVQDDNNPRYMCWLFVNSAQLQKSISEYYAQPTHRG